MSEAGSACAQEPPIVPTWRTAGSPIKLAAYATIGASSWSASLLATSWCRVRAPMATCPSSSRT